MTTVNPSVPLPEEHYARGLELLGEAEAALKGGALTYAHSTAAVAQAQFSAAAAGTAMRVMEVVLNPAQPVSEVAEEES